MIDMEQMLREAHDLCLARDYEGAMEIAQKLEERSVQLQAVLLIMSRGRRAI
jgi:hypothetical protein